MAAAREVNLESKALVLNDSLDQVGRPSVTNDSTVQTPKVSSQINEPRKLEYTDKNQIVSILHEKQDQPTIVEVRDVINMIADLRGCTRDDMIHKALRAWFYHALGFPILEAECQEQARNEDAPSGLVAFRMKLHADYEHEAKQVEEGQELSTKIRDTLISALPSAFTEKKDGTFERMIQISWTKGGSVELGGVVTLSLVVLIVMALGLASRTDAWGSCPCFYRSGEGAAEGYEYANALKELGHRGVHFEVHPDGSATMVLPPYSPEPKWSCPDCCIL